MSYEYKVEEKNVKSSFKCHQTEENQVEYCIFFYDKYVGAFSYRIPRTLLMYENKLEIAQVTTKKDDDTCEAIRTAMSKILPLDKELFINIFLDSSTLLYQEKNANKYFMFFHTNVDLKTHYKYSWSEDLSSIDDANNHCAFFAKWITKKKLSTGQKASIVALLAKIAAAPISIGVGVASYKYAKNRQHKYLFDKKKPNFFVPVEATKDMMPTEKTYQDVWELYKKTLITTISQIKIDIISNKKKLLQFLDQNANNLFPVPTWKNPSFLENQAKLTTVVLYLNKKNKASKAAIQFWEQDKEIRRPDFIEQLKMLS